MKKKKAKQAEEPVVVLPMHERLKFAIDAMDMKKSHLAKVAGISRQHLNAYLKAPANGGRNPKFETLEKIANALNMSAQQFL